MNKGSLRTIFSEKLRHISEERKKEAEKKTFEALLALSQNVLIVASFAPFKTELNITPFNQELAKEGRLCLPRVTTTNLSFYACFDLNLLAAGKLGALEPPITKELFPHLILVPALAFDKNGNRLGRGKGFYDRYLSEHPVKSVGIGFKEQLYSGELPLEVHDQKVDSLLLF